jgi:hypothetical protein
MIFYFKKQIINQASAENDSETQTKSKYSKSTKRGRKKKEKVKTVEEPPKQRDSNENQFNPNYLFDYLISPLKVDYEFGIFILTFRIMVFERNRYI